jgi:hypothetical protein
VSRAEEGLRRVDRDVVLALFLKRVHQVGELELPPLLAARSLDLLVSLLGKRAGVVEQPTDQGRFPVVHVPHDDDPQRIVYVHCVF